MPVTKDQAHQLASLAAAMRPHGARRWDEPGIVAAIAKVAHLQLADVAMAVTRAAADRTADSPGVIAATTSLHWREKVAERTAQAPTRRGEECDRHPGQRASNCGGCRADQLAGDTTSKPTGAATDRIRTAALAEMRAAIRPHTTTEDDS